MGDRASIVDAEAHLTGGDGGGNGVDGPFGHVEVHDLSPRTGAGDDEPEEHDQ